MRALGFACVGAGFASLLMACTSDRAPPGGASSPVFDEDVAPILEAHCVSCHGASDSVPAPAAGWSATSFLSVIACVEPSGAPASIASAAAAASSTAPILAALATSPHQGLLSDAERSSVQRWIAAGAPAFVAGVHAPGIIDPRSPDFHGSLLRAKRWSPMLDGSDPEACGRCHQGTPAAVPGVTVAALGAPACTTCHSEPAGALACDTCHGSKPRIYPPRDSCFFPADLATAGAHAAHVQPSAASASGIACTTCHPTPSADLADVAKVISGTHGDGQIEVVFDKAKVTGEASYDVTSGACAVSCHDLGGASPKPRWTDTTPSINCTSCHGSPPAGHFSGACSSCHAEANAAGTALTGGPLHMNGRVDLGNGSGLCGACHGTGASPWPTTAAHPRHRDPTLSDAVACASCHTVPTAILDPVHLDGVVHVTFTGLAIARGAEPVWNGTTCTNVACHGAKLADVPAVVPAWADASGAASACGACHSIPPGSNHTTSTSCSRSDCHGTEIAIDGAGTPSITPLGLSLHVNGAITP